MRDVIQAVIAQYRKVPSLEGDDKIGPIATSKTAEQKKLSGPYTVVTFIPAAGDDYTFDDDLTLHNYLISIDIFAPEEMKIGDVATLVELAQERFDRAELPLAVEGFLICDRLMGNNMMRDPDNNHHATLTYEITTQT
jgi:hypothetical protein